MSHHTQIDFLLEWSKAKLAEGQETPEASYQLMKLREALEAFAASTDVTIAAPPNVPGCEHAVHAVLEDDLVVTVSTKARLPRGIFQQGGELALSHRNEAREELLPEDRTVRKLWKR